MANTSSWIERITGIGVILTLIFVAIEIRSNTRAVRGQTMQDVTEQSMQLNLTLASVPELRSAFSKALAGRHQEMTLDEEDALISWYGAAMRLNENRFRQNELGLFGRLRGGGASVGGGGTALQIPFFRLYWEKRRSQYPEEFRTHIDSIVIPRIVDSIPRLIQR